MEFITEKYYVITNNKGGYWDRITKEFRGILFATEYFGNSKEQIEFIIENDVNIKDGYYSVKKIIRKKVIK